VVAFVSKSSTVNSTSGTSTVITTPAGVSGSGNQRAVAIVGVIGTGNVITDPTGATWTKLGEYAPETNFKTAAYYRNITGTEAANYTWGWSVGGRNFGHIVLYSDVDLSVPPVFAVQAGTADATGPHSAPGISVADGGWLITGVAARQSPGVNGAVPWSSSDALDSERYDVTATNTAAGAQLATALYDSNRALTAAGGGGGSLPAGTAPLNKYNNLFATRGSMLVGQTNAIDFIDEWQSRIAGLDIMRVFPNSGMPPPWTDPRIAFIQHFGGQVFLSTKIDGDNTKIDQVIDHLEAMPSWIKTDPNPNKFVWITDRHEPEGDVPAATYVANITEFITKLHTGLSAPIRARVKLGPVLTRQWTENTSGRTYKTHDPGPIPGCDFLGIDMYANSWNWPYPDPATFLSKVKAYRYDGKAVGVSTDVRPRIFPELGAIGHPNDTDGTLRAAWLQGLQDILKTWTTTMNGWPFAGWIWWNEQGKSGDSVAGIGTRRWFQFDRIHNGDPITYYDSVQKKNVTDPEGNWDYLPIVGSGGGSGGGGSTPTGRILTAGTAVNSTHVWAISLAPAATGGGGGGGNAWSISGVPI
jgi:hypothetical protein